MKELPDGLRSMDVAELTLQRELRDDLLAPLMRRWPALSHIELRSLKQLYRDSVRIAKHLGQRRRSRQPRRRP